MRYRAKFGARGWFMVSSACLLTLLWLIGVPYSAKGFLPLLVSLLALQQVLDHIFIYWDIDSDRLFERRFWNTREISWCEVTHIGSYFQNQPSSDYLEIDFARLAPMSERGSVIANPEDRSGFIAALRRFASDAEFDV